MKTLFTSIRIFFVLTLLTGVLYPLFMTLVGQTLWPYQASGSLMKIDNKIIGSELIAQKFTQDKYFHSRSSIVDYATIPSGASNQSFSNQGFMDRIEKQKNELLKDSAFASNIPPLLLTTSASGLDPHLSPEAVMFQIERIIQARHLDGLQALKIKKLIEKNTELPLLGFIGEKIVNILKLNVDLDKEFP